MKLFGQTPVNQYIQPSHLSRMAAFVATLLLLALLYPTTAGAAPFSIPSTAAGVSRQFQLQSHDYNLGGGGAFHGTVVGNGSWFWCVDIDNTATWSSYHVNVTPLDDTWTGGENPLVQKGLSSTSFGIPSLSGVIEGTPHTFVPTNLQRYQSAAWLISRMTYFATGGTNAADSVRDLEYQRAAWALLDEGAQNVSMTTAETLHALTALKTVILDQPRFGFQEWAVISGSTPVIGSPGDAAGLKYQTFLTTMHQVPEPDSFLLFGGGMCGLVLLSRKRGCPRAGR